MVSWIGRIYVRVSLTQRISVTKQNEKKSASFDLILVPTGDFFKLFKKANFRNHKS